MLQGYNASNAPRANQETNQGDGHSLEVSANDVNIVRVDAIKSLSLFGVLTFWRVSAGVHS